MKMGCRVVVLKSSCSRAGQNEIKGLVVCSNDGQLVHESEEVKGKLVKRTEF